MSGNRVHRRDRCERGQALVLFVLGLIVMMGFTAMAVDVGLFLRERRGLQNAADAAALAGAQELPGAPSDADTAARQWAANNGIETGELTSVQVSTTNYPNDTIGVTVERDVDFVFGRVLGLTSKTVSARAVAMVGSPAGASGLAPFAVEESVFQGLEPGDTTTLKYNATSVSTGNFLPLALDGTGSSQYEQNIREGSDSLLCAQGQERPDCPSTAETQTGNMVGPTRQGLRWIIQNTTEQCDNFDEVFTPDPANPQRYVLKPGCNRFVSDSAASYRFVIVPVIDELCNGHCIVNVMTFALFFVEGLNCGGGGQGNTCEVSGRYVEASVDVEALIGPYDPQGSLSFVRLVQ